MRTGRGAAAVLGMLVAIGCAGDDGAAPATTSATAPPTAPPTTTDPTAAITAAFTAFFDGSSDDNEAKLAQLESPEAMRDLFGRAFADPGFADLIGQVQAEVLSVTPTSDSTADVDYRLLLDGAPATEGTFFGRAVLVDGDWRIADSTFCNVVGLGNPAYAQEPACLDATGG